MATLEELEDRVAELEAQLSALGGDHVIGSAMEGGSFSLPFPARFIGPNGTAYVLRRTAGGGMSFVLASAAQKTDWSDA